MLVRSKIGTIPGDPHSWIAAFRAEFPCADLSDDEVAYSLTYDPLKAGLGEGWPHAGIERARKELAGLTSAEPDDVQVARELLKHPIPETVFMLAAEVTTQYEDLAPVFRSRWRIDQERLEKLREHLRQVEVLT
jgi:hypothetical protein